MQSFLLNKAKWKSEATTKHSKRHTQELKKLNELGKRQKLKLSHELHWPLKLWHNSDSSASRYKTQLNDNAAKIMDVSLIAFLFFSNSSFASNVVCWAASCFSCRWFWKKTVTWQKKITARDTLLKIAVPCKTIVLLTRNRSTVWNRDRNHANALGNNVGKQPSVTNSGNIKERISHGYVPLCA